MKKKLFLLAIVLVTVLLVSLYFINKKYKDNNGNKIGEQLTRVRIGWQIPWAVEGQLTQVLKQTSILENNNLEGDFKGFSAGGPLNEAALAGDVDVIFTADQPAATLLSKNTGWKIIGRLMYNRVSLYVPPMSPVKSVADLKGKTIAMPFGAAVQRMALKAEENAGLDSKKDVNNINLGIYEQSDLVKDKGAVKWGDVDAMAGFDPTPAIFEEKGLVRNLEVGKVVSVIMMSDKFIKNNPEAPSEFLKSFKQAYEYYRSNKDQANNWFVSEAKLDITPKALDISASIEPNLENSNNEIRIGFIEDDYRIMQEAADFIFDQGLIKTKINMKDYIDLSYLD